MVINILNFLFNSLFSSNVMSSNASLSTKDNDDIIIRNINFVLYTVTVVLGITGNAVVIWMAGIKLKVNIECFKYLILFVSNIFCVSVKTPKRGKSPLAS